MSFFQSIVRNVKEFYSELNSATLTGAIDVIVVEQEDGSFKSSPFHVRFGKLGVLKAREKIVDLEINGEPVEIHMKLDDTGAAFFVENVLEEDEDWSPDLATSPIPDQVPWDWASRRKGNLQPQELFPHHHHHQQQGKLAGGEAAEEGRGGALPNFVSAEAQTDTGDDDLRGDGEEGEEVGGRKGKLNKKKRRRRNQLRHSRKGSRSSIKDIIPEAEQDMFYMDDVNDADQEDENGSTRRRGRVGGVANNHDDDWIVSVKPNTSGSLANTEKILIPRNLSLDFAASFDMADTAGGNASSGTAANSPGDTVTPSSLPAGNLLLNIGRSYSLGGGGGGIAGAAEELSTIENSLIGSRVPIEEAATLEALLREEDLRKLLAGGEEELLSKSVMADFHYFSDEDEEGPLCRSDSPITSDSELERGSREETASSAWRWGELPSPSHPQQTPHSSTHNTPSSTTQGEEGGGAAAPVTEQQQQQQQQNVEDKGEKRSIIDWFTSSRPKKDEKRKEVKVEEGMYLDDLMSGEIDPKTAAIYLSPPSTHLTGLPGPALEDIKVEDPLSVVDHPGYQGISISVEEEEEEEGGVDVPRDDDCESGNGPSLPMSPNSNHGAIGGHHQHGGLHGFNSDSEDDQHGLNQPQMLPAILARHLPDFAMSLCGGLSLEEGVSPEQFEAHQLTYSEFVDRVRENKNFLNDKSLVFRVNEKYTSWTMAAPILMAVIMFKEPLPASLAADLTKDGLSVNITKTAEQVKQEKARKERLEGRKYSSWFGWFGSSAAATDETVVKTEAKEDLMTKIKEEVPDPVTAAKPAAPPRVDFSGQTDAAAAAAVVKMERRDSSSCSSEDGGLEGEGGGSSEDGGGNGRRKRFRKTLRLDSEKLRELNLKSGSNEVQFSVTTAFQGTTRCKCHIYLWKYTDKIVISDIDGTITKSDVLGHILPVIGRDWAQSGVAELFTKIRNNGYHIMYLSARAIGQATITKDYLQSVKQGDVCLPDGPLFLNPESLIHAFRKEVIDRNPEEFKIRCLKDIQSLFEERNPFFAGYGNRPNDAYAYRAVGIPVSRIFTINPAGELRHELTQNFQTSYESQSLEIEQYFPNLGSIQKLRDIIDATGRKQSLYFDLSEAGEHTNFHHHHHHIPRTRTFSMGASRLELSEVVVVGGATSDTTTAATTTTPATPTPQSTTTTTSTTDPADNHSDPEAESQQLPAGFRVRSGTDISDALSSRRYKFQRQKSLKTSCDTHAGGDAASTAGEGGGLTFNLYNLDSIRRAPITEEKLSAATVTAPANKPASQHDDTEEEELEMTDGQEEKNDEGDEEFVACLSRKPSEAAELSRKVSEYYDPVFE